jgi:uncharacterized protein YjbI with pentapeptide repeats
MQEGTDNETRLAEIEAEKQLLLERIERLEREKARRTVASRSIARVFIGVMFGASLRESVSKLVDEFYARKVEKETVKEAVYALLHRLTRVGTIGLIIALTPLLLAALQVYYLSRQNEKLDFQNRRIEQQTYLQEAERRSSLVFLFDNVLDKMDEELKVNAVRRELSPQLIGRIVALSKALKPYRYLENDAINPRQSSPERGQLLLSLLTSNLHPNTLDRIFQLGDFSHVELQDIVLDGAYLRKIKLPYATMSRVSMVGADLTDADFSHAELVNVRGFQTDRPNRARFDHANFFQASISKSDFSGCSFKHANFSGSHLRQVDFSRALLNEAKLEETRLDTVQFDRARLINTRFSLREPHPPHLSVTFSGAEVDSATFRQLLGLPGGGGLRLASPEPRILVVADTPYVDETGRPFIVENRYKLFEVMDSSGR